MKNILTFDIEEWFHANYCDISGGNTCEDTNFRKNMEKLLQLCSTYNCKATFFTLGCIGESYRDIVEAIAREGHEVASHGYCHELAYTQTGEEFREDVKKSVGILEDIIGTRILGYRAPSWSIVEKNLYFLEILEELGLKYDASIFPTKNFLFGIPHAERKIHRPVVNGRQVGIYEIPTSVFNFFGRGIGYSGGFYFRFFPGFFVKELIRRKNSESIPSIVYLHPREIDITEKRLELPLKEKFIHYYNVKGTFNKLEGLMKQFSFTSIRDYLQDMQHINIKGHAG